MNRVSAIIPTLNAGSSIGALCFALSEQTFRPYEIIVIDSSSSDDTRSIAEHWGAKAISISRRDFNHGGTRNLAAAYAQGDILVFLTQDAIPVNNRLVEYLIGPVARNECAASYGRQIARIDAHPPEQFARLFNYPPTPAVKELQSLSSHGIKTFFFSNVCSAINKAVFKQVGCFPDNVIMNEDLFLAARLILLGFRIAYVSDAQVYHSHDYDLKEQFKRYFDIGVFFRDNQWILEHATPGKEGARFWRLELSYLIDTRNYQWLPYSMGEIAAKYFGFALGFHHPYLPVPVKRLIAMHPNYWTH